MKNRKALDKALTAFDRSLYLLLDGAWRNYLMGQIDNLADIAAAFEPIRDVELAEWELRC